MSTNKLVVEVLRASNLPPKDGEGSASPYVEVEYANQRLRTTSQRKTLNPEWKEELEFTRSAQGPHGGNMPYWQSNGGHWQSDEEDDTLQISVWTVKSNGQKVLLGKGSLHIGDVIWSNCSAETTDTRAVELGKGGGWWSKLGGNKGEVYFRVWCKGAANEGAGFSRREIAPGSAARLRGGGAAVDDGVTRGQKGGGRARVREVYRSVEKGGGGGAAGGGGGGAGGGGGSGGGSGGGAPSTDEYKVKDTVRTPLTAKKKRHIQLTPQAEPHQLVEIVSYLFVHIDRARNLKDSIIPSPTDPNYIVKISLGNTKAETKLSKPSKADPSINVWQETFAFICEQQDDLPLKIQVKEGDTKLGDIEFRVQDIPERYSSDSPVLAPQWYHIPSTEGGELMLSVWKGDQDDEALVRARFSDSEFSERSHSRSAVYQLPRLWYLRVHVLQAEMDPSAKSAAANHNTPQYRVRLKLQPPQGQIFVTRKQSPSGNLNIVRWAENVDSFLFVATEPFIDQLYVEVIDWVNNSHEETVGIRKIPLNEVPTRGVHHENPDPPPKWFELEPKKPPEQAIIDTVQDIAEKVIGKSDESKRKSRIKLKLVLEGGYHVHDEPVTYISDTTPSDRKLIKKAVGVLELGIRGATGLQAVDKSGGGAPDAYCVVKYGRRWVRTRTLKNTTAPQWHEQYQWDVFDRCTVLTVGVFQNNNLSSDGSRSSGSRDGKIGKVRIRLSTLQTDLTYAHKYPLVSIGPKGPKSNGEIELVVRVSTSWQQWFKMLGSYVEPQLPKAHYTREIELKHLERVRNFAMQIINQRLQKCDPALREEVVAYMLEAEQQSWSFRRAKANALRVNSALLEPLTKAWKWFDDVRTWKNPVTTVLVIIVYVVLALYPWLILPTAFFYMFLISLWQYRFRKKHPPHMDLALSGAFDPALDANLKQDILEEELKIGESNEIIRLRYHRMLNYGVRVQIVLGHFANQVERFQAFLNWRDTKATGIFTIFCLLAAILLYAVPPAVMAILVGLYVFRPPMLRKSKQPSYALNFFKRLPSNDDCML